MTEIEFNALAAQGYNRIPLLAETYADLDTPLAIYLKLAHAGPEHERLLGRMMALAPRLAMEQGCNPYPAGGFRLVVNTGTEAGQEVHHLHLHVIGGPRPWRKGL